MRSPLGASVPSPLRRAGRGSQDSVQLAGLIDERRKRVRTVRESRSKGFARARATRLESDRSSLEQALSWWRGTLQGGVDPLHVLINDLAHLRVSEH